MRTPVEHIPDYDYAIHKLRLGDTVQNHPDILCIHAGTAVECAETVVLTKQSLITKEIRCMHLSKEEIRALYERFCK